MTLLSRAVFLTLLSPLLVIWCGKVERGQGGGSTADYDLPRSLASLVRASEVIVVAEYDEISDAGSVTLFVIATPATPVTPGPPGPLTMTLLKTQLTVGSILKSDGIVRTTEHEDDADSDWPHVWPVDTEFILFMKKRAGYDTHTISWGWCGRILTGGTEVTCSDGDRTVLPFMSGVDRDEFIAAIQTEVASPSDTGTPWPTGTDEPPEPTEIP